MRKQLQWLFILAVWPILLVVAVPIAAITLFLLAITSPAAQQAGVTASQPSSHDQPVEAQEHTGSTSTVTANDNHSEQADESLLDDAESDASSLRDSFRAASPTAPTQLSGVPRRPKQRLSVVYASNTQLRSLQNPVSPSSRSRDATLLECRALSHPASTIERTLLLRLRYWKPAHNNVVPNDWLAIDPENAHIEVESLLSRLQMHQLADWPCYVLQSKRHARSIGFRFHQKQQWFTPRELIARLIDFHGPFDRVFLRELAEHCSDANDRRDLLFLSSTSGTEHYQNTIVDEAPSLDDLLAMYPSCTPPFRLIVQMLSPLRQRLYAVCGTNADAQADVPTADATDSTAENSSTIEVELAVDVARWISPSGALREGICSTYLDRLALQNNAAVLCDFVSNPRMHPPDVSLPLLLIGRGLGIAPCRGILQHRVHEWSPETSSHGSCILLAEQPAQRTVPFQEELARFTVQQNGRTPALDEFICTQSAEDSIADHASRITQLLVQDGAHAYVINFGKRECRHLHASLATALRKAQGLRGDQAEEFLYLMQSEGRLMYDSWEVSEVFSDSSSIMKRRSSTYA